MPHQPRDVAAGRFHIFTHCVWAVAAHFKDDIDRVGFLRHLAHVCGKSGWKCIAFCLMTSHYHLIVEVNDGVLPIAMYRLNLSYSRDHNRRHSLRGHAQFRRYGSRRIVDDADLLGVFKYIALNPVEAGICERPGDYRWSSYSGTVGLTEPHSFVDHSPLLACFSWPDVDPRAALRRVVENS